MITEKWKKHSSVIWEYGITEDFVPVKKNKKYYAFFTHGTEHPRQRLGMAVATRPTGRFSFCQRPMLNMFMRLGSVIYPCELTDRKWRLYYVTSPTHFYDWNTERRIGFLESDDLMNWKIGGTTDVREEGLLGQPCCHIVDNEFLMLATEIKTKNGKRFDVINAYFSKDGIHFKPWKSNPLIKPNDRTEYSTAAGNPSFIADNGLINIFFEGRCNGTWKIFQAEWNGKTEAIVDSKPIFHEPTANPYITKFNKYYLYYGSISKNGLYRVGVIYQ